MSFATEGFSAIMSFLVTENAKTASGPMLHSGRYYAKRRIISGIGKRGKELRPLSRSGRDRSESVHLPLLVVRDELVEHQRVDVAAASPEHHQHDHLELVEPDGLARQAHRALDDELAQQRSEDLRAFEKSDEAAAFKEQLGRF